MDSKTCYPLLKTEYLSHRPLNTHGPRGFSVCKKVLALENLGSHCTAAIKPKHLTYTFMVLNNPEVLIKMKADIAMKDPLH